MMQKELITTGVTTNGTVGTSGAYTQIVDDTTPFTLSYQCTQHAYMGSYVHVGNNHYLDKPLIR